MRDGAIAEVVIDGPTELVRRLVDDDRRGPTQGAAVVAGTATTMTTRTECVVEIGETNLWVTVARDGQVGRPTLVKGGEPGQFPADLRVTETGRWFWGVRHRVRDTDVLVSHILSRVDDPVPMVIGGEIVVGAELMARQLATLFGLVKPEIPVRLTLVHPVDLSRRGRTIVERHLRRRLPAGTEVHWVSRATAAVAASPECADLAPGDRVGILHVGGSSVEAAVWTQTDSGSGDVGSVRVDRGSAGHAVDDALLAALRDGRPAARLDVPLLRRECERAKIALSSETSVDLDVDGQAVRMVRSDIEQLSARLLARQLDTLGTAVTLSEREGSPLRMILLLGGAAGAPALVEAASARFEVPVLAVPRVGDAVAERPSMALAADPAPASAPASSASAPTTDAALLPARGTTVAPAASAQSDPTAAALARARRRWTPVVSLTAATAATSTAARASDSRADAPVATPTTLPVGPVASATPPPALGSPAKRVLPAAFRQVSGRPTRIALPQPTHMALAAAFLIAVAAVPAIGGALQSTDDRTGVAADPNGVGNGANAGIGGGLLAGLGLSFTPGASGPAGPADNPWLANPTGTLGPNQLLSMNRPAGGSAASSAPSTASGAPAAVAAGTVPASGTTPASTPAGGSTPAGTTAGGSTPASTPAGGSTPASTNPPASDPAPSNPPASDPAPSNPPAGDPPPASDPPPADPQPSDPAPSDPAPVNDVSPASTPEPQPSSSEASASGGSASLADGSGGTAGDSTTP